MPSAVHRKGKTPKVKKAPARTSHTRKPAGMSVEEWQLVLRREFGREQNFTMKNLGSDPIFSDFQIGNPKSGGSYRVSIRGTRPGDNYCSCPDFAVNTLGTCKHIEFTLAKLEAKRGGKATLTGGYHPSYSEIYLRYGAMRQVAFRPGTECPPDLQRAAKRYFDEAGILQPAAFATVDAFLRKVREGSHECRCYPDALQFIAQVRDAESRRDRILEQFPKGALSPAFNKLLNARLYPYQRQGALFAARAGRCILADDMGLGKTIQAIAAIEILARTAGVTRALIVCPTSLKHQWRQEIERFTGRSAEVVEGLFPERKRRYATDTFFKIINYDVVHQDAALIDAFNPDVIVLDEAQRIKNWKTRRARAVKRLRSEHAIVLTGTPIENRIDDLHSIMEFVDRFRLGPLFRFLADHQVTDDDGKVVGYKDLDRVMQTLEPVLIRRTKSQVLQELPDRVDKHFFVSMTKEQWDHHEEAAAIVSRLVMKWRHHGFLTETDQQRLMAALQTMRMACNSTYLIDKTTDLGPKPDEAAVIIQEMLEEPDLKIVVFSQWLGTHELLQRRLDANGIRSAFYHGSLDAKARKACLDQFKTDPGCRVLLCTDSGGVGLNLQFASVLVNMDQPWNPAVLEQRIGRIHRMGQQRTVRVVHFVAENTIEHRMLDVLKFKSSLFAGVLDGGESEISLGGSRLKKFMETVEKVAEGSEARNAAHANAAAFTIEADAETIEAEEVVSDETSQAETEAERAPRTEDPWAAIVTAGAAFFTNLNAALQAPAKQQETGNPPSMSLESFVGHDEKTGETYLRVPMPPQETMATLANALSALATTLFPKPRQ